MKKLLILLLFVPLFSYGQTIADTQDLYAKLIDEAGDSFHFSKVKSIPNKSQADLCFLAKSFFVEYYPSAN